MQITDMMSRLQNLEKSYYLEQYSPSYSVLGIGAVTMGTKGEI